MGIRSWLFGPRRSESDVLREQKCEAGWPSLISRQSVNDVGAADEEKSEAKALPMPTASPPHRLTRTVPISHPSSFPVHPSPFAPSMINRLTPPLAPIKRSGTIPAPALPAVP